MNKAARERGVQSEQIVQYGLPIRKGFWADRSTNTGKSTNAQSGNFFEDLFAGLTGGKSITETPKESSPKSSLQTKLGLKENLPTVLIVGKYHCGVKWFTTALVYQRY